MIWSVSTSARSRTETLPSITSIGLISAPIPDVDKMALDCGSGRHPRTDQMGTPTLALTTLEIAVRGRGAALSLDQSVGVHSKAHRAARLAPLEASGAEDLVQALFLRGCLDLLRPGHDHRPYGVGDATPLDDRGRLAQILDPGVGAGADEDALGPDLGHRRARL